MTVTDVSVDNRQRIMDAAVRLLNGSGLTNANAAAIAEDAGLSETEFAEVFASVEAVFVAVVESLIEAQLAAIQATLSRRRSLTDSMQIALLSLWTLVETRVQDHQATRFLMVSELTSPGLISRDGRTVHRNAVMMTEKWLSDVETVHHIRWELPITQLAQLTSATLDGLLLSYLFDRNGSEARRVLEVFGFQLAQHGRRVAKNYPY